MPSNDRFPAHHLELLPVPVPIGTFRNVLQVGNILYVSGQGPLDRDGALWPLLPEAVLPAYQVYLVTRDEPVRNTPTELFLAEIMGKLREPGREA